MRNRTTNVAQPDFFAVQRTVGRKRIAKNNCQFGIIRIINNFQMCFLCRRSKQGFRHVSASLAEISVNNQQRFHYASPAVS